jgi:HD-GYP domain-containing protein (c-di-GMP phosphodiesterase class II)
VAVPLHQQLQATGEQAQALIPHLERFLCFEATKQNSGHRLLFDSQAAPDGAAGESEQWADPLDTLEQQGSTALHSVAKPGYLILFVAQAGSTFAPAEAAALTAFAELLTSALEQAGKALQALQQATQVAHDFARLRDFETGNHLERVSRITGLIAAGVSERYGLDATFIEQISLFSRLHDIGKIGIPDAILLKPGRLDADEMAVMRSHVEKGLEILAKVLGEHGITDDQPATELMANVIGSHHERLDGSGYPAGLKGEQIPIEGRIVAVADVFDAVTSTRPYRRSATVAEGLALLRQQADEGKLDPACVAALEARPKDLEQITRAWCDLPA